MFEPAPPYESSSPPHSDYAMNIVVALPLILVEDDFDSEGTYPFMDELEENFENFDTFEQDFVRAPSRSLGLSQKESSKTKPDYRTRKKK